MKKWKTQSILMVALGVTAFAVAAFVVVFCVKQGNGNMHKRFRRISSNDTAILLTGTNDHDDGIEMVKPRK